MEIEDGGSIDYEPADAQASTLLPPPSFFGERSERGESNNRIRSAFFSAFCYSIAVMCGAFHSTWWRCAVVLRLLEAFFPHAKNGELSLAYLGVVVAERASGALVVR